MCGLILAPRSYSPAALDRALDCMSHRGLPGYRGQEAWGEWRIGHVRLPIQFQDGRGAQPFAIEGRLTAFVGEFLNHGGRGEFGYLDQLLKSPDFRKFHQADGFWSVVSLLGKEAQVLTDHLGIKPLYWWPRYGIVCSEVLPMFALEAPPPLDSIYLSNCVKFGYDYSGRTPWGGIIQLPPGTVLSLPKPSFRSYWDWGLVSGAPENLRLIIDLAIQNRLVSDREVSLLLSGGLDSSIIYYSLLAQGIPVKCFSVENGEGEFLPEGVELLPSPSFSVDPKEAVAVMQAPLDLGSLLPQIELSRALHRKRVHVCLSGDGADELFGGYSRAQEYDSQSSDVFCELPYYHLPRLDRVMMWGTVELRSPYLAPSVVAAALRLPREQRTSKQALKQAYQGLVPEAILHRKKHPLKSREVLEGGLQHRQRLLEAFQHVFSTPSIADL